MSLLYTPLSRKVMNCIGFASGSGSNLRALYQSAQGYVLRGVFTDRPCLSEVFAKDAKIPCLGFGIGLLQSNEYDLAIVKKLRSFQKEEGFSIDAIFLAGYMRVITKPLLEAFPQKIINVHPADLSIRDAEGKPLLTGMKAMLKALLIGKKEVRSTVHLVSELVDAGPILVISKPLKVPFSEYPHVEKLLNEEGSLQNTSPDGLDEYIFRFRIERPEDYKILSDFSKIVQERQKAYCDWPAYVCAAQNMASGRFSIDSGMQLYLDKKPLPYQGYVLI